MLAKYLVKTKKAGTLLQITSNAYGNVLLEKCIFDSVDKSGQPTSNFQFWWSFTNDQKADHFGGNVRNSFMNVIVSELSAFSLGCGWPVFAVPWQRLAPISSNQLLWNLIKNGGNLFPFELLMLLISLEWLINFLHKSFQCINRTQPKAKGWNLKALNSKHWRAIRNFPRNYRVITNGDVVVGRQGGRDDEMDKMVVKLRDNKNSSKYPFAWLEGTNIYQ